MEYLKLAPDIDTDPHIEEAGWCAARVYELLLKVSGAKDLHGRLSPEFVKPAWLAKRWNLTRDDLPGLDPADFISNGVTRLIRAGLLIQDGQALVIKGWEKFYKPSKTGAQRTRDWRDKLKVGDECDGRDVGDEPASRVTEPIVRDGCDKSDATPPTPLHPPTPPTNTISSEKSDEGLDGEENLSLLSPEEERTTSSVDEVLDHYVKAMKANGKQPRPTKKRRRLVSDRLREGIPISDLKMAINGLTWSDWHMGRDPRTNGTAYTDLRYCLKDAEAVEAFIERVPASHRGAA